MQLGRTGQQTKKEGFCLLQTSAEKQKSLL